MKNQAAVLLGKLGGSKKSAAKRKAARENGKKGGRPRKIRSLNVAAGAFENNKSVAVGKKVQKTLDLPVAFTRAVIQGIMAQSLIHDCRGAW
jgi:hypothetical protein